MDWFKRFVEGQVVAVTPHLREICNHFESLFAGEYTVIHEEYSTFFHLDLLCFEPTVTRPFSVICTVGLSAKPLGINPSLATVSEILMCYPGGLDLEDVSGVIREFSRMIHLQNIPLKPFLSAPFESAGDFAGGMTFPVESLFGPGSGKFEVGGQSIDLMGLMLLTQRELDYKMQFTDGNALWSHLVSTGKSPLEIVIADRERASFV